MMNQDPWKFVAISAMATLGYVAARDFLTAKPKKEKKHRSRRDETSRPPKSEDSINASIKSRLDTEDINLADKSVPRRHKQKEDGEDSQDYRIFKFCVTGGPCAGKTTALARVSHKLRERGFNVFIVPEAATMIAQGGGMINLENYTQEMCIQFQRDLLMIQMDLEDHFWELARLKPGKSVIFCDRGLMDGSAYVSKEDWQAILDELNMNVVSLRDKRYDAVIHMVTAADGAEKFYNQATNQSRYESVEVAVQTDHKTRNAWVGHPRYYIVDNGGKNFEDKIQSFFEIILKNVGFPSGISFYKKYLLQRSEGEIGDLKPKIPSSIRVEQFDVEETYLKTEDKNYLHKLRRQGQHGNFTYILQEKSFVFGQEIRSERQITAKEYLNHMQKKDPERKTLIITRQCFLWEGIYFILNTYLNVYEGCSLLIVETDKKRNDKNLPPFIEITREVTDEKDYSAYIMAKKAWFAPVMDAEALRRRKPSAEIPQA